MNVKAMFTRDFALEVCMRYAGGESIDDIAESSGNTREEIEALLKAYHPEMEEAFRQIEGRPGSTPTSGDKTGVLERIATALERLAGILECRERKGV